MALLLVLAMIFCLFMGTLTSCKEEETPDENGNGGNENGNGNTGGDNSNDGTGGNTAKINYTVNIRNAGGRAMPGITVTVWQDSTYQQMENFGVTDENGSVVLSMKPLDTYVAKLSGVPEGYTVADSYSFTGTTLDITLTSKVISNTNQTGVVYTLGSIMRDFTVINTNGDEVTLSKLLEEKDAVLINFWYINCSWCGEEFPYMESAYQQYSDDIAIVGLNPYTSDTMADIKTYKTTYGLSFDLAHDVGLAIAFGVKSYPTSVLVDRYGAVCLIVNGAITGEKYFSMIFEHFTATDYKQQLLTSYEELSPREKPDVTMPDSETVGGVLNSGNINVTYYPEEKDEYAWPFVEGTLDGVACIKSSNAKKDSSYSIMYADVVMKAGEALAFDYFCLSEFGSDILHVIVDNVPINAISGVSEDWETCYPFVATEDGTYTVAFTYLKDSGTDVEDDIVYLKSFRIIENAEENIDTATYIPRMCATDPYANGDGYETYSEIVLGEDGYYHVGSADGPLLLADLMGKTNFSSDNSVFGFITDDSRLADYYEAIVTYCNYASNSQIYGLCTVDETLRGYLEIVANTVSVGDEDPNRWLQFCRYYDAYGTDGAQLSDPIMGLAPHSAYPTVENTEVGLEEYPNIVSYDRVLMPRGLWYSFTPSVSGAYRIVSNLSKADAENTFLEGWIFLEDGSFWYQYSRCERIMSEDANVYMYAYLEAGTTYYIDIAYNDLYYVGSFGFKIEYLGEDYNYFRAVSPGAAFTTEIDEDGNVTNHKIAGGVEVVYNEEDGYYYNKLADGSMGTSKIYADFTMFTSIFGQKALYQLIEAGAFDFTKSEDDHVAIYYYENFTDAELREEWGANYEAYYELYQMSDIKHGIYHGSGEDLTELAEQYYAQIITEGDDINVKGCVAVNAELADLLQQLMDKYTFEQVENSWVKLCYFYEYVGEGWVWIPSN